MNSILFWLFTLLHSSGVPAGTACVMVLGDDAACEAPAPPPPPENPDSPFGELTPRQISNGF